MLNKIDVVAYQDNWPKIFENEREIIHAALSGNIQQIEHIGSTAIPGLSAKPKIDILAVVNSLPGSIPMLENGGYQYKGEYNIPCRYVFSKKKPFVINLHVSSIGHGFIGLNLSFRDYLLTHQDTVEEYQKLKYKLLRKQNIYKKNNGFSNYNLGKDRFIKKVLSKAKFNEYCLNICTHYLEWDEFYLACPNYNKTNFSVNINQPGKEDNRLAVVLYLGVKMVAFGVVNFSMMIGAVEVVQSIEEIHAKKMHTILKYWLQHRG
ncbi:MAG: GrpB family protein [Francisellaceae bacterium]|jgi:GrpB-like predicted nucleotidyltransferase (UPF0157 family)|nr:GrpB family protein [Francisellaceae bacterium]MBT6207705.1 GrpB family protein [Francisellaceae bacterium]MBT6538125.1 GrpB family protein [Francisellaceae bacterium]